MQIRFGEGKGNAEWEDWSIPPKGSKLARCVYCQPQDLRDWGIRLPLTPCKDQCRGSGHVHSVEGRRGVWTSVRDWSRDTTVASHFR